MNEAFDTGATDWKALPGAAAEAAQDEARVRGGFWRKLKRGAARVPFAEDAASAYFAAFDRATPLKVRAALLGALAYFVLPADAVPDILPAFGFADDAAVLVATLRLLSAHIRPEHRELARSVLDDLRRDGR